MTIEQLSNILNRPSWLRAKDISIVTTLAGKIPVTFDPNDTIFVVAVYSEILNSESGGWNIYLRIEGKTDVEQFYQAMCAEKNVPEEVKQKKLKEYALFPDNNHMYNN